MAGVPQILKDAGDEDATVSLSSIKKLRRHLGVAEESDNRKKSREIKYAEAKYSAVHLGKYRPSSTDGAPNYKSTCLSIHGQSRLRPRR